MSEDTPIPSLQMDSKANRRRNILQLNKLKVKEILKESDFVNRLKLQQKRDLSKSFD